MIIEVRTPEEFEKYVSTGDVLVDFSATWCGPCRMLAPILDQLDREKEAENLKILKVDVDKLGEVAARFGVEFIPLLILMKDGKRVKAQQGYQTLESLKNFVTK